MVLHEMLGGRLPFDGPSPGAILSAMLHKPPPLINGRDDFLMPYELSGKPLFDLLGTSSDRKRFARLDGGHIPSNRLEIMREVLDWLAVPRTGATGRPDIG